MKVEWKKFCMKERALGKINGNLWLLREGVPEFFKGCLSNCGVSGVTHWAYAELPEPPEKQKKWKLKNGVIIETQAIHGKIYLTNPEESYSLPLWMKDRFFEEVLE